MRDAVGPASIDKRAASDEGIPDMRHATEQAVLPLLMKMSILPLDRPTVLVLAGKGGPLGS